MYRYYSSYAFLYSCIAHLVCCGFPFLLSFSALFTNTIFFETSEANLNFLETFEIYLFILTSFLFLIFLSFEVYNYRSKCLIENDCCFRPHWYCRHHLSKEGRWGRARWGRRLFEKSKKMKNKKNERNETKRTIGGTCARGAKPPRVGRFTRCSFRFVSFRFVSFRFVRFVSFCSFC